MDFSFPKNVWVSSMDRKSANIARKPIHAFTWPNAWWSIQDKMCVEMEDSLAECQGTPQRMRERERYRERRIVVYRYGSKIWSHLPWRAEDVRVLGRRNCCFCVCGFVERWMLFDRSHLFSTIYYNNKYVGSHALFSSLRGQARRQLDGTRRRIWCGQGTYIIYI